jgi:ABC transport system ATP-binding/permease protein
LSSGALFQMWWGLGILAALLPARLGVAAIASYVDLNRQRRAAHLYEDWMWAPGAVRYWLLVAGLGLIFLLSLAAAVACLQQRWCAGSRR